MKSVFQEDRKNPKNVKTQKFIEIAETRKTPRDMPILAIRSWTGGLHSTEKRSYINFSVFPRDQGAWSREKSFFSGPSSMSRRLIFSLGPWSKVPRASFLLGTWAPEKGFKVGLKTWNRSIVDQNL